MKAAVNRARILTCSYSLHSHVSPVILSHFLSTSPLSDDSDDSSSTLPSFDSSEYSLPSSSSVQSKPLPKKQPTWNQAYRDKANQILFNQHKKNQQENIIRVEDNVDEEAAVSEEEDKERMLARTLLETALLPADDEEDDSVHSVVKVEDQRSLSVGIIGAPNAGKSCLTNYMTGTKVAAVSRKTNTTTHEVLGVMTKGNTQISFFDTPGLMIGKGGVPFRTEKKYQVDNAWSSIDLYDLLIVIFDVHRHLTKPDSRVIKLIKKLGGKANPNQKRVLCMNKVDLVENKKNLLKVTGEFADLPGFERHFMLSGLKGSGVKDLVQYLTGQAINRPWEEDPAIMSEETMKNVALEVVREKMLDHIHQEIPYVIDHRLMDWKELRDGSLRVEQHFITPKQSQRQILVGKNGSKIGRIGMEANEELRSIFKREVHLVLVVRVARRKNS